MKSIRQIQRLLANITIKDGGHSSRSDGMCEMEAASFIAGRAHSESPACVLAEITEVMIGGNDSAYNEEDRQYIKRFIPYFLETSYYVPRPLKVDKWKDNPNAPLIRGFTLDVDSKKSQALLKELSESLRAAVRDELAPFLLKLGGKETSALLKNIKWDEDGVFEFPRLMQEIYNKSIKNSKKKVYSNKLVINTGLNTICELVGYEGNDISEYVVIDSCKLLVGDSNWMKIRDKVSRILIREFKAAQVRSISQRKKDGVFNPLVASVDVPGTDLS